MYTTLRNNGIKNLPYVFEQNSPYHKAMLAYDDKAITIGCIEFIIISKFGIKIIELFFDFVIVCCVNS